MPRRGWLGIVAVLAVGGLLGAGAVIASIEVNRATSGDAFCGSCHSMRHIVNEAAFNRSRHHNSPLGVRPSCGDCHIPKTNWFVETYTHVASGVRDIIAEKTHDFSDAATWEKRRIELAHYVRDEMRRNDSVTCRGCHAAEAIAPASERGRAAHALLADRRLTCIDCHFNLVHAPVPPSEAFLRGSGMATPRK
jgi:nitrate/TMAO reductase-like tetraheme cytochrome c subunit